MRQAAKWLLYAQLALTVAALVPAGLSMAASSTNRTTASGMTVVGGAMMSTSVFASAVFLIAAAILALVALRRPNLYTWASIALVLPLVSAVVTSFTGEPEDTVGVQYLETSGIASSVQETMRLLEWSYLLMAGAMILAAAAAVLLMRLKRRHGAALS
jgi:hypothetical protein